MAQSAIEWRTTGLQSSHQKEKKNHAREESHCLASSLASMRGSKRTTTNLLLSVLVGEAARVWVWACAGCLWVLFLSCVLHFCCSGGVLAILPFHRHLCGGGCAHAVPPTQTPHDLDLTIASPKIGFRHQAPGGASMHRSHRPTHNLASLQRLKMCSTG